MKKILIFMCVLTTIVVFFSFEKGKTYDIVPVVSQSVTNKVLVIDAGHGKQDEGAINSDGVSEEELNLEIALKLQKLLESNFAAVILTRSDENGIYEIDKDSIQKKKISDMKKRAEIANNSFADLFISIHLNMTNDKKYWGWQTFYRTNDENSKKLATLIQSNLNSTISKENKRVPLSLNSIYIMKNVKIPIALVECGFLSNENESNLLQNPTYQEKLAWGIYNRNLRLF